MAEADESGRVARVAESYMGMSARDFFESVRSAAIDADSITRRIQAMESREGVRAQTYGPRGRGGVRDAMAATDARMDFEGRIERRREEDYRLIDAACSVIYGADQSTGGVGAILGAAYADALWLVALLRRGHVAGGRGGRGDERAVVQGRRWRGDGRHRLLRARAHEPWARAR